MLKTSLVLALAAAATIAAPAHAATAESESVAVRYTDLDLASEEGQKILEQRLDRAAREVCGMEERATGTRIVSRAASTCYKEARGQLERQFAEAVRKKAQRGG